MLKNVSSSVIAKIAVITIAFVTFTSCTNKPKDAGVSSDAASASSEAVLSSELSSETESTVSSKNDASSQTAVSSAHSSSKANISSAKTSSQKRPSSSQQQTVSSKNQTVANDIGKTVTTDYGFTATLVKFTKKSDTVYEAKIKIKLEADYLVGENYQLKAREHLFLVDAAKNPVAADNVYANDGQSILGKTVKIGESLEMTAIFKTDKGFSPVKFRYMYDERGFKKIEFSL